jgi:hypothetical protein
MPLRSNSVTSRFQRRHPGGRHDLAFKVAFGGNGAAAKFFRVSRMTIWRWRHDRSPLPCYVAEILERLVHDKVRDAHEAEQELRWFRERVAVPAA